ncbi:auxin efflux carrier [Microdochium trichocladiopsis]|uniref:Auxin efflux carrier n=1 Tax=Microdochium trichocladiopsis TaxID=1682393 RepID=A0A9P9BQM7_9PEZI|nr:auxin efflux carrier [Microdochium trichocladiopsis]KAH7035053.1 auxin efflux carrier [Microdochium trichocladiopsis]
MASGFGVAFAGALQASLSVLLTIGVGVVSAQFGLVSTQAAEDISHLCVQILLPCLLIENLGQNLEVDTIIDYVPLVIWAALYTIISIAIGRVLTIVFKLPAWATPALAFNNTESMPLLLLQALGTTGTLATLTGAGQESAAIERARSYFLAASVITNTITFGEGPEILKTSAGHSGVGKAWRWLAGRLSTEGDAENASGDEGENEDDDEDENADQNGSSDQGDADEQTSLLPHQVRRGGRKAKQAVLPVLERWHAALPGPVQYVVSGMGMLINAPFIGALIGIIIGLTPPLKKLFFADMSEGGYFNAWLTTCIKNVGELFVSLQVVVVGVKLSLSLRKWKEGDEAGSVSTQTFLLVSLVRFIVWPAISIPLIWVLAAKTDILPNDPILWWTLMIPPTGPPAMKNLALADVCGASQKVRMSIARFLTMSYMITPLISLSVVGALVAAKNAKEE